MMRTTSGAAPATSGIRTDVMTTPAVPSDHVREDRSRQGPRPSAWSCCSTTTDIRSRAAGSTTEIQAPEMPLAGRLSPALATVRW